MSGLRPCPFCGGEAKISANRVSEDCTVTAVCCTECEVRTGGIEAPYGEYKAAAEQWNSRPGEQAARVEGLQMARDRCADFGLKYVIMIEAINKLIDAEQAGL